MDPIPKKIIGRKEENMGQFDIGKLVPPPQQEQLPLF